jgi:hypothetical protein
MAELNRFTGFSVGGDRYSFTFSEKGRGDVTLTLNGGDIEGASLIGAPRYLNPEKPEPGELRYLNPEKPEPSELRYVARLGLSRNIQPPDFELSLLDYRAIQSAFLLKEMGFKMNGVYLAEPIPQETTEQSNVLCSKSDDVPSDMSN